MEKVVIPVKSQETITSINEMLSDSERFDEKEIEVLKHIRTVFSFMAKIENIVYKGDIS